MIKVITPFDPNNEETRTNARRIFEEAPVMHLTEEEVLQTLRLIQLHVLLLDEKRSTHFSVTVYQDDQRLTNCSNDDKFLALLLDADVRGLLLTSKRCRYSFGGTQYSWRKVAARCSLITTASMTMNAEYGGRYLGRGWKVAPHIQTLRRWIIDNTNNPDIKKLQIKFL